MNGLERRVAGLERATGTPARWLWIDRVGGGIVHNGISYPDVEALCSAHAPGAEDVYLIGWREVRKYGETGLARG